MGRRSGGDGLDGMFWIEGCLVTNGAVVPKGLEIAETNDIRVIDYSRISRVGEIVRDAVLSKV